MIQPTYDFRPRKVFQGEVYFDSTVMQFGLKDVRGNVVAKPRFDHLLIIEGSSDMVIAIKDKKFGLLKNTGKMLQNLDYDRIYPMNDNSYENENHFLCGVKNNLISLWNFEGKKLCNHQFSALTQFYNGLCCAAIGKEWGVINTEGKFIINPQYKSIRSYQFNQQFLAETENGFGLINLKNEVIVPFNYDQLSSINQFWYGTSKNGNHLYDAQGNKSSITNLGSCYHYGAGYIDDNIICSEFGRYGLVGKNMDWLIPPAFDTIYRYSNFHVLKRGEFYGYDDLGGRSVVPVNYNQISPSGNNFILKLNGEYGLVNNAYQFLVPVAYDSIQQLAISISGGTKYVYAAQSDSGWQLCNNEGQFLKNATFDEVLSLNHRVFAVKKGSNYHFGTMRGDSIIVWNKFQFASIRYLYSNVVEYKDGKKYGIIQLSHNGNLPFTKLTEAIYEAPLKQAMYYAGSFVAKKNGNYQLINANGQAINADVYSDYRIIPATQRKNYVYMKKDDQWYGLYPNGGRFIVKDLRVIPNE